MSDFTHFLYVCRTCGKRIEQPISLVAEETPIPTCCAGSRRDMAYRGATRKETDHDQ